MRIAIPQSQRWIYGICIVLTLLAMAGLMRELFFPAPLQLRNIQMLPAAKPLASITLKNIQGTVDLQQARGTWFMVFMGYTYCPDVCPLELQKLGQMLNRFSETQKPLPTVVFVSVDPERDTVQKTAEYAVYFHPAIQGLTGDNLQLQSLANFFGVTYSRAVTIGEKEYLVEAGADMPAGSGEHYAVNHSGRIFIINPAGEYVGSFSPPFDVEMLYGDMLALMSQKRR